MNHARIVKIFDYISKREATTYEELQQEFNVCSNTIRRDVAKLIAEGKVNKIYGGVCVKEPNVNDFSLNERAKINIGAKNQICAMAAKTICDGDTVFIDAGTTVQNLLKYLYNRRNITIVTHNVYVVADAVNYDNINIIALGGTLNRKSGCVISADIKRHMENIHFNKAFFCATGISENGDVTSNLSCEREIKQLALKRSFTKYLLVDSGKFNNIRSCVFANVNEFDFIITNNMPESRFSKCFGYAGVKCIYSDKDLEESKCNYAWSY